MPQISLYIDKDTLARIEKAAAKERISISKWVGKNIKKVINELIHSRICLKSWSFEKKILW